VERRGSRVALQFIPIMNKRRIRICGTEDQSLRVHLNCAQEELAKKSAANGVAVYLEEGSQVESSSSLQNQRLAQFSLNELSVMACRFRAKRVAFDLAADFLYGIVACH
jgi:hypothetical protein